MKKQTYIPTTTTSAGYEDRLNYDVRLTFFLMGLSLGLAIAGLIVGIIRSVQL